MKKLVAIVLSCASTLTIAVNNPGEYITEGGYGVLEIKKSQNFTINSLGGNFHSLIIK